MPAIRGVVIRSPGRVIGPSTLEAGYDKGVMGRDAGIKCADHRRAVWGFLDTLCKLGDPVVLPEPAPAPIEESFDGAGRPPDLADRARYALGEGPKRARSSMNE